MISGLQFHVIHWQQHVALDDFLGGNYFQQFLSHFFHAVNVVDLCHIAGFVQLEFGSVPGDTRHVRRTEQTVDVVSLFFRTAGVGRTLDDETNILVGLFHVNHGRAEVSQCAVGFRSFFQCRNLVPSFLVGVIGACAQLVVIGSIDFNHRGRVAPGSIVTAGVVVEELADRMVKCHLQVMVTDSREGEFGIGRHEFGPFILGDVCRLHTEVRTVFVRVEPNAVEYGTEVVVNQVRERASLRGIGTVGAQLLT